MRARQRAARRLPRPPRTRHHLTLVRDRGVHSWQTYGNGKTGDRNKRSKMQLTMWLFCMVGALLLPQIALGTLKYPVPYAAGIFPLWMLVTDARADEAQRGSCRQGCQVAQCRQARSQ